MNVILPSFIPFLIYLCLEGGRERGRNISVWLLLMYPSLGTWSSTQACALTGNRTGNISAHRLAPKSLSHTSQGSPCILIIYYLNYKTDKTVFPVLENFNKISVTGFFIVFFSISICPPYTPLPQHISHSVF